MEHILFEHQSCCKHFAKFFHLLNHHWLAWVICGLVHFYKTSGLNDLQPPFRPFRTNTQKDALFIIGDWNEKVGSQETPGVTGKFGLGIQKEAGQRLIEFCQKNALVIANTLFQKHKRRLYTWTSPDGQHQNQTDYIICSQRWRSLYSQQKQDQELTMAQIMNSLLPNSDLSWRK